MLRGHYIYDGNKYTWEGKRLNLNYSHILHLSTHPDGQLHFRSGPHTNSEYGTGDLSNSLGILNSGDSVLLIEEELDSFQVAAMIEGELKVGYIAKLVSSNSSLKPLSISTPGLE